MDIKNENNVVSVDDLKLMIRDYLEEWKRKEYERNVKLWFDDVVNEDI